MIRINLIPKKVSKKKMGLMQHVAFAGLAFLLAAGGIGYSWMSLNTKLSNINRQVAEAKAEKEKLKNVNQERQKYEKSIKKLKSQLDIIVQIKAGRFLPIRLFDELTKVLDAKTPIWLTKYTYGGGKGKKGAVIKMDGFSLSNPDLAAFVTKLEKTPYFQKLNLIVSQKSTKGKKKEEQRPYYKFSLTASPQMKDDPVAKKVTE
jgi:type IV pilus assembly protein PilN